MINSWINTVLPTPAPPNNPILPPLEYGSNKSITLIPVKSTSVSVDKSSNLGGTLWIERPLVLSKFLIPSMASPTTLNTRPLISSPIGILIGAPVSTTFIPRTKPSVASIEIVRTRSSPKCC
ncbi:hypothetical protein D3C72_1709980 [compost metagenome]